MAISENVTAHYITISGLLGNEQYIIMLEYGSVMGATLCFIGIIANIIIIRIFFAMGVKDGMTVSFLSLAIFDLGYLVAGVSLSVSVMFYSHELKSSIRYPIEPYGVSIYFTNIMILINVTNVLTTTFLALARSMCVARPLQFKNTFTKHRTIMFMGMFAVLTISMYIPMFLNMGMSSRFDKLTNTSRPSWWRSSARESVKEIVWVIADGILPVSSEFIVIVCVIILFKSLRESSRFRQSSASVSGAAAFEKHSVNTDSKSNSKISDSNVGNTSVDKLTGKDVKVVQQVVLISVVYVLCNIPKLLISLITIIEPEFGIGRRYMKLYMATNGLRKHFEILNSATNLAIYCRYNTKFRSTLLNKAK